MPNRIARTTLVATILACCGAASLAEEPIPDAMKALFKAEVDRIAAEHLEIATADPESGIDIYMGTGGAPEGVLAAAALQCTGGSMLGRLVFRNNDEIARAEKSSPS